ncbi:hypothetical protein [Moorella sp. E308F]|uniref:hypothetical protein n=1 Tax=Moorella sp. E308F TaxID=2572682 RepID=UPI001C0EB323|nr:hypothetical protein [Moorella sp. E308F]
MGENAITRVFMLAVEVIAQSQYRSAEDYYPVNHCRSPPLLFQLPVTGATRMISSRILPPVLV